MNSINEVDIKSIIDIVDKATNGTSGGRSNKDGSSTRYLGGSISNYTKNLIMTFPCMCDDSLSASTASMISRANERNIVTMLHMLFSSVNMATSQDAIDIIKGIHNNIKTNYSVDDYIDAMEDIGSAAGSPFKNPLSPTSEAAIIADMMKQIREAKSFPIDSIDEFNPINKYEVSGSNGLLSVKEAKYPVQSNEKDNGGNSVTYKNYNVYNPVTGEKLPEPKGGYKYTPDDIEYEKKLEELNKLKRDAKDSVRKTAAEEKASEEEKKREEYRRNRESIEKRLIDADVKKANEMQPSLMIINYNQLNDKGNLIGQSSFVAGVKSRLIPVESQDIMERIFAKNKTKVNFKNFIRATTGEISFVKDFLLCINQAKIDAKNASKKGLAATMWKTLENRSIKNNFNKIRRAGNDASAITVLVISQETVNALNKYYHIDLSRVNTAKEIMNTYNLMGIIIADDSLEIAKFLYAGNDTWDQQAYSFLEKEGKDKSYKQVVNLLNKNMI